MQDRGDGGGEVVVADMPGRDTAESFEGVDVAFEEGFLPAGRVNTVDGFAGVGESVDEHVTLRSHSVEDDPDFPEIDLSFSTRGMVLGDEDFFTPAGRGIDFCPADAHVVADG